MKSYQTKNLRNIGVFGHGSCGKTILCEAALATAGVISRIGSVENGTTVSDHHQDERKRKISIHATPLYVEWLEKKINLIDTPGYDDFVGEMISSLSVVDLALIVVNAAHGIEVGTERAWRLASESNLPKIVAISALDKDRARFDEIFASVRETFGKKVLPLNIPVNTGPEFNQIADVLNRQLITFKTDGSGDYEESELSGALKETIDTLHEELLEAVAESDDELLEKFFDQGLSDDDLRNGIPTALLNGSFVPVFCTAAAENIGVPLLLNFIAEHCPSPLESTAPACIDTDTTERISIHLEDPDPVAFVYRTLHEPHIGDISSLKVYSGTFTSGMDQLTNTTTSKSERLGQFYITNGKERESVKDIFPGDICSVVKLKHTHTGNTLCGSNRLLKMPPLEYPEPNSQAAIKPKSKGDEDKIGLGLSALREEDPTFNYRVDQETRETVIYGQGELHLQIAADRLRERYHVEIDLFAPRVPYRETIRSKGESKFRHKKQTGGAGQFAEVWMRINPLTRGAGVEFIHSLVGQNVDRGFVPSVEKGVNAVCEDGVLAGCHVVDLHVEFYDGKMHPVDSKDIAFQIAGKGAFREAFLSADPCLLEPIYDIEIRVPETYVGDVMGDISSRRGKISGIDNVNDIQIVKAKVPQANLYQYATVLRSISHGSGTFGNRFSHYEEMPADMERRVLEDHGGVDMAVAANG